MMRFRALLPLMALAALLALAGRPAAAQSMAGDIVRGVVNGADSLPVPGAEVTVRSARTLETRRVLSDAAGRWRVVFPDTSHAYEVAVRRIGNGPARVRVERRGGSIPLAAVVLEAEALVLDAVTATVGRRPPVVTTMPGGDRLPHERSAVQSWDGGDHTRFDRGELDAVAALGSGATVQEDGTVSVGGLSPGQNAFRIGGLSFGGRNLPRLGTSFGYGTSQAADAARGGFSGGEVTASLVEGHFQSPELAFSLRGSDPALQAGGAQVGGVGSGYRDREMAFAYQAGILDQRASIAVSGDLRSRTAPLRTLRVDDPSALRALGVSPDSAARLTGILQRLGIPAAPDGVSDRSERDAVNVLANVGLHQLFGGMDGGVHVQADRTTSGPLGTGPSTLLAAGSEARDEGMNVGGSLRRTIGNGFLHEAGFVWDGRRSRSAPYLALPGASVRVASDLEAERTVGSLRFGGGGARAETRASFWEGSWSMRWNSLDERHQRSVGAEARSEGYREHAPVDGGGSFTFASLADLEAGRPSAFTRILGARERSARLRTGALYAEDLYRPSEQVEVRFGLRAEGLAGARVGAANDAVAERFRGRTGRLPGEIALTPRFGFAWSQPGGLGGRGRAPYGTLSGSVGLFRDRPASTEAALYGGEDGTGEGSLVVSCVGGAVPAPDWAAYLRDPSAAPAACLDGGGPVAEGGTPWVSYFARGYRAPAAWKGALRWSGRIPVPSLTRGDLRLTVEGQYTRGIRQPSTVDVNLADAPRFTLVEEGGRPVFVRVSSIIPETGAVPVDASRRDAGFGLVSERRSDGAVDTRQVTVRLAPHQSNYGRFRYELAYTRSFSRAFVRAFEGAPTGGDPRGLAWQPNPYQAAHVLQAYASLPLWEREGGGATLHLTARVQSGLPFTPEVAGDVNGDALANDAAFIPDPASAADPALAEGMRALLESSSAAECLSRQLGRIAGAGSCTGPWTADLRAELLAGIPLPVGRGMTIAVRADNILGGVDRLLHGPAGRRGWGDAAPVDRTLLSVRGFDPGANRFLYDVNPRFGSAAAARELYRRPFVLEVSASFTLAKSWPHVATGQLAHALRREAGTAEDTLAVLAGSVRPANPMRNTLQYNADRLLLTGEQSMALEAMSDAFEAAVDSLTADDVKYLAGAIGREPSARITRRVRPVHQAGEALRVDYLRCMRTVLSEDQWALMDAGWIQDVERAGDEPMRIDCPPAPGRETEPAGMP
ncbi:carboxypeptidase-like regulatory domain-containing protein [Longimicrobium sp.]|uniref:carboxypeptidase-like regulatory domain-containing protein n=1 Tax=Longimicrobium sp. TaxID=2029185 RepID=UPI003B3B633A